MTIYGIVVYVIVANPKEEVIVILVAIICGIVGILVGGASLGMMIFAGVNIKYGIGFIQSAGSIPLWITIFSCFRFRDWFVGEKG